VVLVDLEYVTQTNGSETKNMFVYIRNEAGNTYMSSVPSI